MKREGKKKVLEKIKHYKRASWFAADGEPKTTDAGGTTPAIGRHLRIFSWLLESQVCAGQKLCFALREDVPQTPAAGPDQRS